MFASRTLTLAMALSLAGTSLSYDLVREYSGSGFFDGWDFFGSWDNLTSSECSSLRLRSPRKFSSDGTGAAWWVDSANATTDHLAYVNDAGQAIIRVDNTTTLPKIDPKIFNVTRNTVCPAALARHHVSLTPCISDIVRRSG